MSENQAPDAELRYATDITRTDVDGLIAFLRGKIDAYLATVPLDSAGGRMAAALDVVTTRAHATAGDAADKLTRTDLTKPDRLEALHKLLLAWQDLHGAVRHWEDQDGYDTARWRELRGTSAHWEQYHQEIALLNRALTDDPS